MVSAYIFEPRKLKFIDVLNTTKLKETFDFRANLMDLKGPILQKF
ncbi:UNVERIFIED_ORG: hypothetical protein C7432_0465 [Pantoea allii]|jgi:hypothetical protein|nr:hypothetical protein SAMN03097714_1310 [Pantoea ananatis]